MLLDRRSFFLITNVFCLNLDLRSLPQYICANDKCQHHTEEIQSLTPFVNSSVLSVGKVIRSSNFCLRVCGIFTIILSQTSKICVLLRYFVYFIDFLPRNDNPKLMIGICSFTRHEVHFLNNDQWLHFLNQ
jgi:hypothetical protein